MRRVDALIDAGNSFSGSEQNCAFLNLGDGTFATVSAISGVDFPDDARALALTDWDGDGDLDVWVTNRTAPMVRYLRNDAPARHHALTVRLEGTTGNRDAIGARVEVILKGQESRPLVQTVKAGEGYLGQSSRRLHFGLGENPEIASVRVTWAGGKTEDISGVKPDTLCTFAEGDVYPEATPLTKPARPGERAPLTPKSAELAGAVALFQPFPLPPLPAITPDGKPVSITDSSGPLLVNLWASWCPDCATELAAWQAAAGKFKAAGVSVALLCADGRDDIHHTTPADAWPWLAARKITFPAAALTDEAFRRFAEAHRLIFGPIVNLPVPTTYLLNGSGRIAAVYRGPVAVEKILADVADVKAGRPLPGALPYQGRWLQNPITPDPTVWLTDLARTSQWDDAVAYFTRESADLRRHRDFAPLATAFAAKLDGAGRTRDAVTAYEAALSAAPEDAATLNNLAWILATAKDATLRNPQRAVTLAEKAAEVTKHKDAAILDTLNTARKAAAAQSRY